MASKQIIVEVIRNIMVVKNNKTCGHHQSTTIGGGYFKIRRDA